MTDKRRYGVIEVERINDETFHLVINDQMWSEVEWSASRQAWCIQDAAGQCLAHVESIVGQDRDVQTAIRLAKKMIVDGRMPAPEEAHQQRKERQEQQKEQRESARLGEPWVPLEDHILVGRRLDDDWTTINPPGDVIEQAINTDIMSWLKRKLWKQREAEIERARKLL